MRPMIGAPPERSATRLLPLNPRTKDDPAVGTNDPRWGMKGITSWGTCILPLSQP
jgi:hypothetical protein